MPRKLPAFPKISLLQTAIGDYRQAVLQQVIEDSPGDFQVFAGELYFDATTQTTVQLGQHLTPVKNHYILGRRLLWQSGMWRSLLQADVAIFEFNPRILSGWVLLLLRRLLRKRSVLWGHAWPRSGRAARTAIIRRLMGRLADTILVYTESQARELATFMPRSRIVAAPNALYSAKLGPALGATTPTDFMYVGRLVPEKKPDLLLRAFALGQERLPNECRLIIVGDGPMRPTLESEATKLVPSGRVVFTGHVADPGALRPLYEGAIASVSPGYVGLSITQSLSFGVPMIVARNEPHAPEIEAATEGVNSVFFEENSATGLADALVDLWQSRETWFAARSAIAEDCAARYSAEHMAGRILMGAIGTPKAA